MWQKKSRTRLCIGRDHPPPYIAPPAQLKKISPKGLHTTARHLRTTAMLPVLTASIAVKPFRMRLYGRCTTKPQTDAADGTSCPLSHSHGTPKAGTGGFEFF